MNYYGIPLQVGTPQVLSITLGGVAYQLTLQYRNDPGGQAGWVLDIADSSGNPLLQGLPLITGADILEQYQYMAWGGALWVQTTSDPDAVPTFENLGNDGLLYWVTQ